MKRIVEFRLNQMQHQGLIRFISRVRAIVKRNGAARIVRRAARLGASFSTRVS